MTRQRLKDLASLGRRRARQQHGLFLVEGVRSVQAALAAGAPLAEILVGHEAEADPRVAALVAAAEVPVERLPAHDLGRISDAQTSQGVIAVARRVVRESVPPEGPVLLLDGVQDPGNVGALVRSAAWFGIATVVADERSADFESPKAVRASMGGLWDVRLARVPSLVPVLEALAAAGVPAWGADLGGEPVHAWEPPADSALVMGSEAHGLSPEVAAWLRARPPVASRFVHIPAAETARPTHGAPRPLGAESLNVVVAGGILLQRWRGG